MQTDDLRRTVAENVRVEVARGRATCAAIVAGVVSDYAGGSHDLDELHGLAWELVPPAIAAHLEEQAAWPDRTDSDRLTSAFRALDRARIVAREEFTCCRTCGVSEIGDEVADGETARGFVFYHDQDAERAAAGGSLWLAFGSFGTVPAEQVGAEVAAALRAEGLSVDWDGSAGQRLHVRLRWARRRHGRLAAIPGGDPAERPVAVEGLGDLPPMSAAALAELELPWLPEGTTARVAGTTVRRERDRLVGGDGRVVGRFQGLRLLSEDGGPDAEPPREPGLIDVTPGGRPMELPEVLDALRRMPARTGTWLSVLHDAGCVQVCWEDGRLWLETPNAADESTTGKFAELPEVESVLTVLATEGRNAVPGLDGVTTEPW
ncbi:DUF6891 domain-containing protein [Actinoplanes sp. CA-054009]